MNFGKLRFFMDLSSFLIWMVYCSNILNSIGSNINKGWKKTCVNTEVNENEIVKSLSISGQTVSHCQ